MSGPTVPGFATVPLRACARPYYVSVPCLVQLYRFWTSPVLAADSA